MVLDELKKTYGKEILETEIKSDRRMTITIDPAALVPMSGTPLPGHGIPVYYSLSPSYQKRF